MRMKTRTEESEELMWRTKGVQRGGVEASEAKEGLLGHLQLLIRP